MIDAARRGVFVRMFSSALASQALLSAASLLVGLLLIRRTSDLQYGYYILVAGAVMLAVGLQNAFIAPAMVNRMTRLGRQECGDLTGGLYREQRRVIAAAAAVAAAIALILWLAHVLDLQHLWLTLAAIAATVSAMHREYFRMVLLAYRRAHAVLRGDFTYAVLLGLGVLLATFTSMPAIAAVLAVVLAALISAALLSRSLRRAEPWNLRGAPGILRAIAPLGTWSTAGAAIHWSFSQGYAYLVAAMLDVRAVAAIAAVRLLAMPVNLLSTGIGSLMLPLASRWLVDHGASLVLRRLAWFALGLGAAASCYFGVLWLLRDWVFDVVLTRSFPQRDLLLMLWSASYVLMAIKQQLMWLPVARERFRPLTSLTAASAALALACSYLGMLRFGGAGAVFGIVVGELVNTVGVAIFCLRETGTGPRKVSPAAAVGVDPTGAALTL